MPAAVFAAATGSRHPDGRCRSAAACENHPEWDEFSSCHLSLSLCNTSLQKNWLRHLLVSSRVGGSGSPRSSNSTALRTRGVALLEAVWGNKLKCHLAGRQPRAWLTPRIHFGWESDRSPENKQYSRGFPHKFPWRKQFFFCFIFLELCFFFFMNNTTQRFYSLWDVDNET